jgi:hypothetical protein
MVEAEATPDRASVTNREWIIRELRNMNAFHL